MASNDSKAVKHLWKNIIQRRHRLQLTMAILIPLFQLLTGINVIMFYAPVLFKTVGFGNQASPISAVISGILNMVATFVSIASVDKLGRRALFLEGGIPMTICQIIAGTLIGVKFGVMPSYAYMCRPPGWLVLSEIFPPEIRSAAQSITVSVNMFFTFVIAQVFLNMLCYLKFGLFFFFGGFVIIMTRFIFVSGEVHSRRRPNTREMLMLLLEIMIMMIPNYNHEPYVMLPETKNVPVEGMIKCLKSNGTTSNFF